MQNQDTIECFLIKQNKKRVTNAKAVIIDFQYHCYLNLNTLLLIL